jgi:hypothetical protein
MKPIKSRYKVRPVGNKGNTKQGYVFAPYIMSYDLVSSPAFDAASFDSYDQIIYERKIKERNRKIKDILNDGEIGTGEEN